MVSNTRDKCRKALARSTAGRLTSGGSIAGGGPGYNVPAAGGVAVGCESDGNPSKRETHVNCDKMRRLACELPNELLGFL